MEVGELLDAGDVVLGLRVRDKAALLAELAARAAARLGRPAEDILDPLVARERLGSTGLGRGFALPHARLAGVARPFGLLARLSHPMAFEAIDGQPVDVVFLLLLPQAGPGSVAALAAVSRAMRDAETLRQVRRAGDAAAVMRCLGGVG